MLQLYFLRLPSIALIPIALDKIQCANTVQFRNFAAIIIANNIALIFRAAKAVLLFTTT